MITFPEFLINLIAKYVSFISINQIKCFLVTIQINVNQKQTKKEQGNQGNRCKGIDLRHSHTDLLIELDVNFKAIFQLLTSAI